MKRINNVFSILILAGALQGCPADSVTSSIQLEGYSQASVDALIIDGKTKLQELAPVFGAPKGTGSGACGSDTKKECMFYAWVFNRINYMNRRLTNHGVSVSIEKETDVVVSHFYTEYDKPY